MHFLKLIKGDGNKMKKYKITGGVYLVIDPSMPLQELLQKLKEVLREKIGAVQIWDNWKKVLNKEKIIIDICELCHKHELPVLINNSWELLNTMPLDGIHFDTIPENYNQIKHTLKESFIAGITCNNDLSIIKWADENELDYVSFCSIFPSVTSNSCDLVSFETIRHAREITTLPIFLAGGIRPDNMYKLQGLDFDGVAVISGIMSAGRPAQTTKKYLQLMNKK
jgi:thiamine-phosphate pyrophosphorylase